MAAAKQDTCSKEALKNQIGHHRILTRYAVVFPTAISENYSSSGICISTNSLYFSNIFVNIRNILLIFMDFLKEQDKSSDIERQPADSDCNTLPRMKGGEGLQNQREYHII